MSDIAEAFDYAGDLGVPIVNASLGGTSYSQTMLDAIVAHPNTLYVVAAGNWTVNTDSSPHYPCALGPTNVICVGATDNRDARARFSNWGATTVDLFAPGEDILSPSRAGAADPWIHLSGTSMATPHVAGALALMRAAEPSLNAAALKAALLRGVDRLAALGGRAVTGGRLNAAAAVEDARIAAGLPAPPADSDVDGFADGVDNCPAKYNPSQADGDGDGTLIDNCPTTYNPDQADGDRDRIGDACESPPAPITPQQPVGTPILKVIAIPRNPIVIVCRGHGRCGRARWR